MRLDRWLCFARVFKTRTLAADRIAAGGVRLNGQPCRKPGQTVRPGDVVTAATPGKVRVLRVVASVADLTDPPDPAAAATAAAADVDPDPGAAADE